MIARPLGRLLTAALALGFLLYGAPAIAATGGPASPGWHWVDSDEAGGPVVAPVDLTHVGDRSAPAGGTDSGTFTLDTPFPVTLGGGSASQITVSTDGYLTVGNGSLALYAHDMVTNELFTATVGAAGSRQLQVHLPRIQRFGDGNDYVDVTVTFFEGRHGAVVRYNDVGTPNVSGPAELVGFQGSALTSTPSSVDLPYTGTLADGLSVLYTDEAATTVPALIQPVVDGLGYGKQAGKPTGFYDLGAAGRVAMPWSDSGQTTLDLPFEFGYYGTDYDQLTVQADTGFRFGDQVAPYPGLTLPSAAFPDSGMLFNLDLSTTVYTAVRGTAPHRQYVVEWVGSRFGDGAATARMELVLFEGDDELAFLYDDVPGSYPTGDIGLNHDGSVRHRIATAPVDGTALLWSTDLDANQSLHPDPVGGTAVDAYGYRAVSSAAADGPTYDFIDASVGDEYLSGSDSGTQTVSTPFPVSLYGTAASQVTFSADGQVSLGSSVPAGTGPLTLPDSGSPLLIRPYAADLAASPGVYTHTVGTAPHRRFVVMWDAHRYGNSGMRAKFEVVFSEDSSDVLVQYADIEEIAASNPAVVGINKDGQTRLRYSANAQDIADGTAVLYTTDRLLGIDPPAQVRTDARPVDLGNRVVNAGELAQSSVRQVITLDGVAGLNASHVTLEAQAGESWEPVALTDEGTHMSGTIDATDGDGFPAGADLSVPLRLSVAGGAPLGDLTVGSRLYALDGSGDPTGTIAQATTTVELVTTEPDAPANVVATSGDGELTVAWDAPESDGGSPVTGYTVTLQPGSLTQTVDDTETEATVTGLDNGTEYTATVRATNAIGDSPESASATATPRTVPGAPTGVSATAGDGQATVSWTAPASDGGSAITGYTVTSSPGGLTASADAGETEATVTGLSNGTAYTFTVTATNVAGPGALSVASEPVTPRSAPGAPTGVSATAGDGQATVSWTAPASDGGSAITGYTVTSSPGGLTASADAGETEATVTGLTNGTAYTFTVTAANVAGDGAPSAASSAVTPFGKPAKPAAPAVVAGNQQVTVSWTPPAANGSPLTGYTITGSPGVAPVTVGAGVTQVVVRGLVNDRAYTFTVTATNVAGASEASSPSAAATPRRSAAAVAKTTAAPAKVKKGKKTTIWGTLAPALPGATVTLQQQKGSSWKTVATSRVASQAMPKAGTVVGFKFVVKGKKKGKATYRVVFAGNATHSGAIGRAVTVKVK